MGKRLNMQEEKLITILIPFETGKTIDPVRQWGEGKSF